MDKKLLQEYKLEDMQKRFQQICEYTFITTPTIDEDDEDEQEDNKETPIDGDGQSNGIGELNTDNNTPNDINNNNDTGDSSVDNMDSSRADDVEGEDDTAVETSPMQDGDEVIDIDDLTSSQEETEIKVDGVDDKLIRLLNVVNNFQDALEQNSAKIVDLQAELEKRVPTETEKLNLRSQSSYPYSEQPKEYWEDHKKKNDKYDVRYNNDIPANQEQKEFTVTTDDIRGGNDREIARSMEYNKLSDFLNY